MLGRRGLARAVAVTAVLPARAGLAQVRPVRLIVPAAPGGAIDVIGRIYAQTCAALLQQVWVVENRSGANNTLGAAEVARAAPDGATLLVNADIQLMARLVMRNVPYDPVADFTPIGRLATAPLVLVGNPSAAPQPDLAALLAAAKARPDRFTFANSALGSMGHLATESLRRRAGLDALVVSYRGTAPALTDVVAGTTTLMVAPLGSALPFLRGGQLRGFAIMGAERSAAAPDVPDIAEAGLPGLNFTLWYALWGPKGLPADQVQRLNGALQAAARDPAVRSRLAEQAMDPVMESAADFAGFLAAEAQRVATVAREAGIEPE